MRPHRIALPIAGLALIALLAIFLSTDARWKDPASAAAIPSEHAIHPPAVAIPAETRERTETKSTAKTAMPVSDQKLGAIIGEKLAAWEDDDLPELRDARVRELEALLASDGRAIDDRLATIATLPPRLMNFAFGLPSFQQWMFSQPGAALDWLREHPAISDAHLHSLLQEWAASDRPGFQRQLDRLPEGAWKQKVLTAAAYASLSVDPPAAIACARQLNPDAQRNGLIEMATTEWARREPIAAGLWVDGVHDPALRPALVGSLLAGYAEFAPDLATQWAATALPPGKILDRAVAEIRFASLRQDPGERPADSLSSISTP